MLRRHDEFDEQAVRFLMQYHLEKSELPTALKIYSDLFEALAHEMDAEPSLETQNLVVKIKLLGSNGTGQSAPPAAAPVQEKTEARVAIMPFEALGHEEPNKYVILGLLDEITCRLVRLQSIRVISSNSTRNYLAYPLDLEALGKALDVKYVVVGSIRRRLDRAAINVQIVDVETQNLVGARIHECAYENILALNSDIVESIVNSILPNVSRAELARTRHHTVAALGPHLLLMRAREKLFELTRKAFDAAGELLDQAIESAPYFAPAYATKADWYSIRIWQRWSDDHPRDCRAMEACARRALTLSGSEPRVMALMGHNKVLMQRRFDEARRMFDEALRLAPNDAEVLTWTVPSLAFMGHAEQAIANGTRALSLSPQDPFLFRIHHFLSIAHYTAGNHLLSAEHGLLSYNDNPNYLSNIRMTIAAMQAAGRTDEIEPLLQRHKSIVTKFDQSNFGAGPPFRDPTVRSALISDLRAAGLPV